MSMWSRFVAIFLLSLLVIGWGKEPQGGCTLPTVVTVKINGVAVNQASIYKISSGSIVQLTSNNDVTWTVSNANLNFSDITATTARNWHKRIYNLAVTPTVFSIVAKTATETITLNFEVAAADVRNGDYKLFSTLGQLYSLKIDFDTSEYTLNSIQGTLVSSGKFAADTAEENTFLFDNPGSTLGAINNARFRYANDLIVGALPLNGPAVAPVSFIAARKFVTDPTDVAGGQDLTILGRTYTDDPPGVNSAIFSSKIDANYWTACNTVILYPINSCPTPTVYALTFNSDGSILANQISPAGTDSIRFYIAKAGQELIYLRASINSSNLGRFRIGLPASPVLNSQSIGADTTGGWGALVLNGTASATYSGKRFDGADIQIASQTPPPITAVGPAGLYSFRTASGDSFFTANSKILSVLTGARNTASTYNGYMTLALRDLSKPDIRNGDYKMFSTDGNQYLLSLNFDLASFKIADVAGSIIRQGIFSDDGTGTYQMQSSPADPASNLVNNKFRMGDGLIIGSHGLPGNEAMPFIASRSYVGSASEVPLTNFWIFGRSIPLTGNINSSIFSGRVVGDQLTYCSVASGPLTDVQNCLPENLQVSTMSFQSDGSITHIDAVTGGIVRLYLLKTDTSGLIFIRSQANSTTGEKRFRIGLAAQSISSSANFVGGVSTGGTVINASWGSTLLTNTGLNRTTLTEAGASVTISGNYSAVGFSPGLYSMVATDTVPYFLQKSGAVTTHIAARNSAKAGSIFIGLQK